ncbi:MAG: GNAT family N-acetyltransferase [Myxococcales bacterium]|nr:GNAT family N-acetyltransferase [Myxococcales bacterium]
MSYTLSAHAPKEIKATLCQLWRDNLQDVGSDEAAEHKFEWLYETSPHGGAVAYLAHETTSNQPIGTCALQARAFSYHGAICDTGLFADLAVDKAHRTGAAALQLLRRLAADAKAHGPFAIGFPNAKALPMFKRAGFAVLGQTQRYAVILRHESYVPRAAAAVGVHLPPSLSRWIEEQTRTPAVQRVLGTAADWASMALRATTTRHNVGRGEVQAFDDLTDVDETALGEAIDQAWQRGAREVAVASQRSLTNVQWRIANWQHPRLFVLRDAEGPCAYALTSDEDGVAHIRDLFGTITGMTGLVAQLPSLLYDRGAVSASFRYLGAPWLAGALEAAGFSLRGETRSVAAVFGTEDQSLALTANWHLTDIDEDT